MIGWNTFYRDNVLISENAHYIVLNEEGKRQEVIPVWYFKIRENVQWLFLGRNFLLIFFKLKEINIVRKKICLSHVFEVSYRHMMSMLETMCVFSGVCLKAVWTVPCFFSIDVDLCQTGVQVSALAPSTSNWSSCWRLDVFFLCDFWRMLWPETHGLYNWA